MPRDCREKSPAWRARRAKAAGLAAAVRRHSRAEAYAAGLTGPEGWRIGYRTGYSAAIRW